jgi:(2Fe-2S) ferredoxin
MRSAPFPRLHLFVCANRRSGSPLGPGCAERGDEVYDALKQEVAKRGRIADVWVTKTHCLGVCPKEGATVARYPGTVGGIRSEATPADAPSMLDEALTAPAPDWTEIERVIAALEALETEKVLALARRLKPGLTSEDIKNPHDFPELDDPDWHYADGVLTGVSSIATALRALRNR